MSMDSVVVPENHTCLSMVVSSAVDFHAKDHFSKFSYLAALSSKHAEPIAQAMAVWISFCGPPKIVQCGNGREFKGALLILLRT